MTLRMTFNGNNIDVLIGADGVRSYIAQKFNQNFSGGGLIEHISLYSKRIVEADLYFSESAKRKLDAWWAGWSRDGGQFSFAVNHAKASQTTLNGAATAGQKVIPLVSTTAYTVGDICRIIADGDNESEDIVIDSISPGVSVTAVDNLFFSYASGDAFMHYDYYPSLITMDKDFNPKKIGQYWSNQFKWIEVRS